MPKREASPTTRAENDLTWRAWSKSTDGKLHKLDHLMDTALWLPARYQGHLIGYVKTCEKPEYEEVWWANLYDTKGKVHIGSYRMYWPDSIEAYDQAMEIRLNYSRRFLPVGERKVALRALPDGRLGLSEEFKWLLVHHNNQVVGYAREEEKPEGEEIWLAPLYNKISQKLLGHFIVYSPNPGRIFNQSVEDKLNGKKRFFPRGGELPRHRIDEWIESVRPSGSAASHNPSTCHEGSSTIS